jgi:hypothetical protein
MEGKGDGLFGGIIHSDKYRVIQEIEIMQQEWNTEGGRINESEKKDFLEQVSEMAECLDVNLAVEHLLPCIEIILVDEAGD